jgi:hypothetical protein
VWYTVKKCAALVKVEDVTPHTFRHTMATQLVRDPEVNLVTAAIFLGHSRLDTTARYNQLSAEDLEEAAKRLEQSQGPTTVVGPSDDPRRTRTCNQGIKSPLLCQIELAGQARDIIPRGNRLSRCALSVIIAPTHAEDSYATHLDHQR